MCFKSLVFFVLFGCFSTLTTFAQTDTTIYQVVTEMPRFPGCEVLDTTTAYKQACSQKNLIEFVYANVEYPAAARNAGIQGTAVAKFVVEPEGNLTNLEVVRDLGGGTGEEVLRVLEGINKVGLRFRPGYKDGVPVRVRMTLPVKFRLQDFSFIGQDTVYTNYDQPAQMKGDSLALQRALNYPAASNDRCKTGHIALEIMIRSDGSAQLIQLNDYNDLGFNYWTEALLAVHSFPSLWQPAVYQERPVGSSFSAEVFFAPQADYCTLTEAEYRADRVRSAEALALYEQGKSEPSIEILNELVAKYPFNFEYRYLRGQALMNADQLSAACEDFRLVRENLVTPTLDQVMILLCPLEDRID